ncbi:bifunctional N(6)-L-threonylcarbamoyladenine synthase/serine/threonine protein kinase [Halorubrum rubrum]|uniref:Probable bifunctional tRNA threonylcarbamoyladenosine biosynthesis protein n=1 Tax=Halorubrum rubrum TaxID=1126240 RepID=A0ABD5QXF6_9EURY|nr:bifunctional N(6)-L-threonylcarbamoyladenine synthase/serine/threonine protein kinase [Halorubrum rubrum]
MRVLGIEGTAWCASAALHDAEAGSTLIESDPYEPDSGGIHPREAAEHMSEAIPEVVGTILDHAEAKYGPDAVDAVAFSRGPGLGPCLRTVGTAARSLAGALDVPLVGVNHMVAHLEIGRHESGFSNPVCLNASGANAHLLGYHDDRYRVLGETMDAGVGNAIDKFTRHVGWTHPGGPKVEAAAAEAAGEGVRTGTTGPADAADLLELPYVVKGMDFSFSGISSAANDAYDAGEPVEEICFSLQEHVFAMLTEVSERALSLTGADELVLGGGVGQNDRLRGMLAEMCAARGAAFHAPDPRYLRDNAGMIAVLGAKMAAAGDTLAIRESHIDPNFRPDEVPVTWRDDEPSVARLGSEGGDGDDHDRRGAEAVVEIVDADDIDDAVGTTVDRPGNAPIVRKRRIPKEYRHPALDRSLRRDRTVAEARLTSEARQAGVPTPLVYDVDVPEATLTLQYVGDRDLADVLRGGGGERADQTARAARTDRTDPTVRSVRAVGRHLARLHDSGFVHGDPTTRNVRVEGGERDGEERDGGHSGDRDVGGGARDRTFLIDFGLGYHTGHVEDHAMDLHVFEGSVTATAAESDRLVDAFEEGYREEGAEAVLGRLREVRDRGRYR